MKSKLQLYPYDKPVYEWHKEELEPTFGEYFTRYGTTAFNNNKYYGKKKDDGTEYVNPVYLRRYHIGIDNSEYTENINRYHTYKCETKEVKRISYKSSNNQEITKYVFKEDDQYKNYKDYKETNLGYYKPVFWSHDLNYTDPDHMPTSQGAWNYYLSTQLEHNVDIDITNYKKLFDKFDTLTKEQIEGFVANQLNITTSIIECNVEVVGDRLVGTIKSYGERYHGEKDYWGNVIYDIRVEFFDKSQTGYQRLIYYYMEKMDGKTYPITDDLSSTKGLTLYETTNYKSYGVGTFGVEAEIDVGYMVFERGDKAIDDWVKDYSYVEMTKEDFLKESDYYIVDTSKTYWQYDNPPYYNTEMPIEQDLSQAAVWFGPIEQTNHLLVDYENIIYQALVIPNKHQSFGEDDYYNEYHKEDTNFKYLDNDMVLSTDGMLNTRYVHKYKTRTAPIDKGYIQDYVVGHEEDGVCIYETIKDYFTKDKYELVLNRYIGRSLIGGYIPKDSRSWYNEDGTPYDWKELDLITANNFRYPIYSNAYNDIQILNNPDKLPNGATLNTNYAIAIFGDEIWGYRPTDNNLPIAWEKPTLYDNDLITPTSMDFGWEKLFDIITEQEDDTHYYYLLKEYFDIKEISAMGVKWIKCYAIPNSEWESTYFTWLGNTYNPTSETIGLCLMYENPADYGYEIGHYDIVNVEKIYNANKYYLPHTEVYDGFTRTTYHGTALYIDGTFAILPEDMLGPLTYHKTVNDGDSLDFTTVSSASIDVELNYRVEEANKLIGSNFTYLLDYGDGKWRPMGLFTIDEVENVDNYSSRITGHDHIYRLNKYVDDFIEAYNYPTTIGKFWHDLCGYCGLIYDEAEDLGEIANIPLKRNFQAVKTTGLQLAEFVAQLFGSFIHIDKDNYEAKISHYKNTDFTLQLRNYKDITYTYYNAQMPNQIRLGFNNDKNIIVSAQVRPDEVEVPYYLMDNALITYNITDEDSQKLVNELCKVLIDLPTDIKRIELSMNTPGDNVDIKVGDILEVQTKLDEVIRMMVMEIIIDGNGIKYSSFGEMNYPVKGDSITSQIIYLEDTRRELNNVINDMGYVAEDLININEKFMEVDNSIDALNNSIETLDGDIAASNERIDNLGEAVNSTAQSVVELGNTMKEFKSTADLDQGLATIDLTNQLTGVVLDNRLQAEAAAILATTKGWVDAINATSAVVGNVVDLPQKVKNKLGIDATISSGTYFFMGLSDFSAGIIMSHYTLTSAYINYSKCVAWSLDHTFILYNGQ